MRTEIASTVVLEPPFFLPAGSPTNPGADRIPVALRPFEFQTEPIVSLGCSVLQQQRGCSVDSHQNVQSSVIVVVSDRHAACGEVLAKYRTSTLAYLLEFTIFVLMK